MILFLLLSFLIPMGCILMMDFIPFFQEGICNLILYGVEAASPTIAVLLVWNLKNGKCGIRDGLKEKYLKHFSLKYCIIGALAPFFILTIAQVFLILHGDQVALFYSITSKKALIIFFALFAEELGWRGFLQEKLEEKIPNYYVPLIIGMIWALWHYHFFLSGSMETPITAFALGCIFESYGYYVITKLTKENILPASLWHFSGNLFFNLYRFDPKWHNGDIKAYWVTTIAGVIYVMLFIVYIMKDRRKNGI